MTHVVLVDIDSRPLFDNVGIHRNDSRLSGFAEAFTAHHGCRHLITKRVRQSEDFSFESLLRHANANVRSIRRLVNGGRGRHDEYRKSFRDTREV